MDGKPHGKGVMTYADGSTYKGEYKNGKPHGHGVFKWTEGEIFKVEFQDGKCLQF